MALTQVQTAMLNGSTNTVTTIQSNGTTAITVDASQNVGIGTTTPISKLTVQDPLSGTNNSDFLSLQTAYSPTSNLKALAWRDQSSVTGRIGTTYNGTTIDMTFGSLYNSGYNSTELMRLTGSGNLLVNSTALTAGSGKLTVKADGGGNSAISAYSPGTGAYNVVSIENGNGQVGRIQTSASATSYLTSSDYRLKENIAPMQNALNLVQKLKPVTYTWKVDGISSQGFIAHELAEVVPDCVGGEKDAVDSEGKPVYQGIDTSFLVATLTAAIQELNAKVDAQAAEIQALKAN
jgi:hypothetical protein